MYDTENTLKTIGTAIRTCRKRIGMTQQDVAEIAGLQRQTISRVEAGNNTVAVVTVARFQVDLIFYKGLVRVDGYITAYVVRIISVHIDILANKT